MYKLTILETILGWIIIIFIIIVIVIKRKKKYKEQLRNLELQKYYKEKSKKNKELPYKLNKNIFTETERFFYKVLKDITNKMELIIMTKVRLADIITTYNNNYKYFNKIKAKHIDFVLIDKDGNIKLLIELDDESHKEYKRQKRDEFLNNIFEQLDIKLLRIQAKYSYNIQKLEEQIKESL